MSDATFDTAISRLKDYTVTSKNEDQRIQELIQLDASTRQEERKDAVSFLAAETEKQFESFWNNDKSITAMGVDAGLYETAQKLQLRMDVNYENADEDLYASDKYIAQEEIRKIQQHSGSRWQKTRQKLVNSASASYLAASASYEKMKKTGNAGFDMNKYAFAEESIEQMMAGEAALIKAEGIKDQEEDYNLAKTELKKQQMRLNLYNKALSSAVTEEQKTQVTKKINAIKKTLSKAERKYVFLHNEQMVHYSNLDGRGDLMTADQLKAFLAKDSSGQAADGFNRIAEMLEKYHTLSWDTDRLKKYEMSNSIREVLGETVGISKTEKHAAFILKDQLRPCYVVSRYKNAEKKDDELSNRQAVIQDYEEYSAENLVEVAKENKYYGKKDFIDKVYHKYRGKITNAESEEFGYIYGMNCSNINGYYRDKNKTLNAVREQYKDAYMLTAANKKLVEDEVKKRSAEEPSKNKAQIKKEVTKEIREQIAAEKKDELDQKVETWEKRSGEIMKLLEDACDSNVMKGNKRLCRMVSKRFIMRSFGIDLNKPGGEPKSQEEKIKEINQHAGTMIKDVGFMSCGNKMDAMYFRPNDDSQVMLTMLCEDGQKCYVTENFSEGEIILPPGTEYELVGAYAHNKKGRSVGITRTSFLEGKVLTDRDDEGVFKGIELVVKVKKNAHKKPQP